MLDKIRNFQADRGDLDSLVELYTAGKGILGAYAEKDLEVPDWLRDNVDAISAEIDKKDMDRKRAKLTEARARYEGHKSGAEKKADALAEINRLEKQINKRQREAAKV